MRSRRLWGAAGWLLCAALTWLLCAQNAPDWIPGLRRGLTVIELTQYDQRLRWRSPRQPDPRIAVVAIDYDSVSDPNFGSMPWERAIHARLIDKLDQAGCQLIVFDVSFAYRQAQAGGSDAALIQACKRSGKVVVGTFVDYRTRFDPQTGAIESVPVHHPMPPGLAEAVGYEKGIGQTWVQRDLDQGLRLLWLRRSLDGIQGAVDAKLQGADLLTLAAVAAQRASGQTLLLDRQGGSWTATLGATSLPLWGPAPLALLDYPGRPYPVYSYRDILAGKIPNSDLHNKILIVGSTCDMADSFLVPRNPSNRRGELPGCFSHAVMLDMLLQGGGLRFAGQAGPAPFTPWLSGWPVACLLLLISAWFHQRYSLAPALLRSLLLGVSYWVGTALSLVLASVYYNTVVPLAALLLFQAWMVLREPSRVRALLAAFIPKEHIESMIHDAAALSRQTELQDATILFADIRDYTVLSEKIPPAQVRALVSRFHDKMAEVFARHGGYVSDFQGDAQMVAFGVTPPRPDHAHCAIQAASELPQAVAQLNAELLQEVPELARDGEVFRFGVGICSGPVSVGYLQGGGKLQHTVLGDTTNTSARLQGKARDLGVITVVSHTTADRAAHWIPRLRPLTPVELKGKSEPHIVYELPG